MYKHLGIVIVVFVFVAFVAIMVAACFIVEPQSSSYNNRRSDVTPFHAVFKVDEHEYIYASSNHGAGLCHKVDCIKCKGE